jgi:hypothetical protein
MIRSGRCGEEKNLAPAGNRNPTVQPVTLICSVAYADGWKGLSGRQLPISDADTLKRQLSCDDTSRRSQRPDNSASVNAELERP